MSLKKSVFFMVLFMVLALCPEPFALEPETRDASSGKSVSVAVGLKTFLPGTTQPEWEQLETRFVVLSYPGAQTLETFQKAIQYGSGWWANSSSFSRFSKAENEKIVQLKVDAVFKRVQEILDMKKKIKKVRILLYPDKTSLEEAFRQTYRSNNPFRAWYEYKTNSISLNVQDCHEGILAHELAHSIIDNFLAVRPPKNTAEILARYVDSHLK